MWHAFTRRFCGRGKAQIPVARAIHDSKKRGRVDPYSAPGTKGKIREASRIHQTCKRNASRESSQGFIQSKKSHFPGGFYFYSLRLRRLPRPQRRDRLPV